MPERLPDHESKQNLRLAMAIAIAEFYREQVGLDNELPEPYLEKEDDETSDLILDLNFGPGFEGRAKLPYEGGVQILHNEKLKKLFFLFRDKFESILKSIQLDSEHVIKAT